MTRLPISGYPSIEVLREAGRRVAEARDVARPPDPRASFANGDTIRAATHAYLAALCDVYNLHRADLLTLIEVAVDGADVGPTQQPTVWRSKRDAIRCMNNIVTRYNNGGMAAVSPIDSSDIKSFFDLYTIETPEGGVMARVFNAEYTEWCEETEGGHRPPFDLPEDAPCAENGEAL